MAPTFAEALHRQYVIEFYCTLIIAVCAFLTIIRLMHQIIVHKLPRLYFVPVLVSLAMTLVMPFGAFVQLS